MIQTTPTVILVLYSYFLSSNQRLQVSKGTTCGCELLEQIVAMCIHHMTQCLVLISRLEDASIDAALTRRLRAVLRVDVEVALIDLLMAQRTFDGQLINQVAKSVVDLYFKRGPAAKWTLAEVCLVAFANEFFAPNAMHSLLYHPKAKFALEG